MKIELKKDDLVSMVMGTCPNYDLFDDPVVKICGKYWGGFNDRWEWSQDQLEKLSEKSLYDLYIKCKSSFKQH